MYPWALIVALRPTTSLEATSGAKFPNVYVSVFRDRGVLEPTSEVSPRAPAPMGRREAEREGGGEARRQEMGRERGGNPAAFVFVPRPGRVRLQ
jgi:hypothetical protein